jgi:cytidylate kinase
MDKVITLDGPSGVGKGTVSRLIAEALGWDYLDSGAIYRVAAQQCMQQDVSSDDVDTIVPLCEQLDVHFQIAKEGASQDPRVLLEGVDVTASIRTEVCGSFASKISALPAIRAALLKRQRDFSTPRGLVADGRDMGTVVFPKAPLKYFLTADVAVRARRRHEQLKKMGISVNISQLTLELSERDARDRDRAVSPTKPAEDAILLDTTELSVKDVYEIILRKAQEVFSSVL